MPEWVIGVDMGTHKSSVWVKCYDDSVNALTELDDDFGVQTTKVLSYAKVNPGSGEILIGEGAMKEFEASEEVDDVIFNWKMHLVDSEDRPKIYDLSAGRITPEKIIEKLCALLSRNLVHRFGDIRKEAQLVITFPAVLGGEITRVRHLYEQSWRDLGWQEITSLQEPIAVAQRMQKIKHGKASAPVAKGFTLVIDTGGGTTDLTLLDMEKEPAKQVRDAVAVPFAGRNIDVAIHEIFKVPLHHARGMKEGLYGHHSVTKGGRTLTKDEVGQNPHLRELLRTSLIQPIQEFLRGILNEPLSYVYLSGGSNRFELLYELLEDAFQEWGSPHIQRSRTDNEVAEGAVHFFCQKDRLSKPWPFDIYLKLHQEEDPGYKLETVRTRGERPGEDPYKHSFWPSASDTSLDFVFVRKDGEKETVVWEQKVPVPRVSHCAKDMFEVQIEGTEDFKLKFEACFARTPNKPFCTFEQEV